MNTTTYEGLADQGIESAATWPRRTLAAIIHGFRAHAALYLVAVGTYAFGLLESLWLGAPLSFGLVSLVSGTTFVFLFLAIFLWLAAYFIKLWRAGYTGSPFEALKVKLLEDIVAPGRVSNALHAFTANGVFFVGFLTIKKNIPIALPFAWDRTFMEWDKAVHFGVLPHEILAPLFQYPFITFLVNVNYNLWFVVILAFFFVLGFRKEDSALRQRYLISYLLTWLVGTCILGTILSSAGPCFFGFVDQGPNPYQGLMSYLKAANEIYPVWAVPTQDTLWASHLQGHGDVEGVSAMPSMHVGTTILFICCAFAVRKRWLIRFTIPFTASILLGSVLLGWHYAIDGYFGALVAYVCWVIGGWIVRRMPDLAAEGERA